MRFGSLSLACALAFDCVAMSASAQGRAVESSCGSLSWSGHAMAYDSDRRLVVAVGGVSDGDSSTAATWGWDGKAWRCVAPAGSTSPQPRNAAVLAYDATRHALVLYGGRRERTALRDTWELTAGGWSRKDSAGPTPEPHGVMAFDPSTHNVLLYHTVGDDGPERGTWGWNGQQWRRLASEPNAVIPDAMFGALGAHRTALLTVHPTDAPDSFEATWYAWSGSRWKERALRGTPPRFSPQAPAARTRTGAIVFAGFEPGGVVRMWSLEGESCRAYAGPMPSVRRGTAMAFDASRGVVVLHGGDDGKRLLDDTWEWDGRRWRKIR